LNQNQSVNHSSESIIQLEMN